MMPHATKSSPKAMVLNYHFHHTFYRNLNRMINHETYGPMWAELSNEERTYVLKGGNRSHGKSR